MKRHLFRLAALALGWAMLPGWAGAQAVSHTCSTPPAGQGTGTLCTATITNGDGPANPRGTGGHDRTFKYYIPSGVGTGRPMVFVLHGGTQNADGAMSSTSYEWNTTADIKKYIVVYPEGKPQPDDATAKNWNDCRAVMATPNDGGIDPNNTSFSNWDDVRFINNLLNWFATTNVAPDIGRIFATGGSNGGLMTLRLARDGIAARFRSFGPALAALPIKDECPAALTFTPPAARANIMTFTYGTEDQLMPPNGGCVASPFEPACGKGRVKSAAETIAYFRNAFGVPTNAGGQVTNIPDINPTDGDFNQRGPDCTEDSQQVQTDYRSNPTTLRFRVIKVVGAGHATPGIEQVSPKTKLGYKVGCRNLDRSAVVYLLDFWGI
jgi:poly(3-hydroxybutyrate) depolymerase